MPDVATDVKSCISPKLYTGNKHSPVWATSGAGKGQLLHLAGCSSEDISTSCKRAVPLGGDDEMKYLGGSFHLFLWLQFIQLKMEDNNWRSRSRMVQWFIGV